MKTTCNLPSEIAEYIEQVESGPWKTCREQKALVEHVKKCFEKEDLKVDTELLSKYMKLEKYFPFDLFPWEKFVFALWNCTFTADGKPRWRKVLVMVARGSGKDGYIAFDSLAMVSPFNPVDHYNIDICANNEEQATTPVKDVIEALELPKQQEKLKRFFYHTKELVQGRKNKGVILGRTNNPKGRDGMRSGKIIFNEVHQYENYNNIKVFRTGLGKRDHPREGHFTSNGEINDGPLDDMLETADRILFEGDPDNGFLPFICRLPSKDAVYQEENWYMANPSLQYRPALLDETRDEFEDWKEHPEQNGDFLTKRMGLRAGFQEITVTDYEKITATNRPLPDLKRKSCTVGIDYAELSDWASVDLHFRCGQERVDINHSWICLQSKTLSRIRPPWKDWAVQGHVTLVDDVSISPKMLAEYIQAAAKQYNIRKMAMDHHRWTLVAEALREIGWDASDKNKVKLVRPSDIMQVEPLIQECFDRELFCWGDCPPLRWATNNTKRVPSSRKIGVDTGNFIYAKIEPKSRKTDPWMALVAAMTVEDVLGSGKQTKQPRITSFAI